MISGRLPIWIKISLIAGPLLFIMAHVNPPLAPLPPLPAPPVDLTSTCRSSVDGRAYLTGYGRMAIPDHFQKGEPTRQPGDFDPNEYFTVFTHLKMAPGYTLDYVYAWDRPMLYARKVNDPSFKNDVDSQAAPGQQVTNDRSFLTQDRADNYLEKVQPDQSPESYFEFVTLDLLGGQFYLFWHANRNDLRILCDSGDLKAFNPTTKNYDLQDALQRAKSIDFTPFALVNEKTISLRFVTFTRWGGFYENIYILDRQKPAQPVRVKRIPLIYYDSGIAF